MFRKACGKGFLLILFATTILLSSWCPARGHPHLGLHGLWQYGFWPRGRLRDMEFESPSMVERREPFVWNNANANTRSSVRLWRLNVIYRDACWLNIGRRADLSEPSVYAYRRLIESGRQLTNSNRQRQRNDCLGRHRHKWYYHVRKRHLGPVRPQHLYGVTSIPAGRLVLSNNLAPANSTVTISSGVPTVQ